MPPTIHAELTDGPLQPGVARAALADAAHGAVVLFEGVVRDHDAGRQVVRLDYSAHPDAGTALHSVAEQVGGEHGVAVWVAHRVGRLAVGDSALLAGCAAPHRAEAFAACAALVDAVKAQVPVWKHQVFADGSDEWVGLGDCG